LEDVVVALEALARLFDRPREPFKKLFVFESTRDLPWLRIYGHAEFARPGLGFFVVIWIANQADMG
jgi:hypothetical protein